MGWEVVKGYAHKQNIFIYYYEYKGIRYILIKVVTVLLSFVNEM